jgi:hypothetical protein
MICCYISMSTSKMSKITHNLGFIRPHCDSPPQGLRVSQEELGFVGLGDFDIWH